MKNSFKDFFFKVRLDEPEHVRGGRGERVCTKKEAEGEGVAVAAGYEDGKVVVSDFPKIVTACVVVVV